MSLLAADSVSVSRAGREVLSDVSFTLDDGELVGLVGPNGSGKSTLLRAIAGLLGYTGRIEIEQEDARLLSPQDRARALAFLPQARDIHWPLSVEALVALGRMPHLRGASRSPDFRFVPSA